MHKFQGESAMDSWSGKVQAVGSAVAELSDITGISNIVLTLLIKHDGIRFCNIFCNKLLKYWSVLQLPSSRDLG